MSKQASIVKNINHTIHDFYGSYNHSSLQTSYIAKGVIADIITEAKLSNCSCSDSSTTTSRDSNTSNISNASSTASITSSSSYYYQRVYSIFHLFLSFRLALEIQRIVLRSMGRIILRSRIGESCDSHILCYHVRNDTL